MNSARATADGDDSLEQPDPRPVVDTTATISTGPVCACGWPTKPCMKLTVCAMVNYNQSRTA